MSFAQAVEILVALIKGMPALGEVLARLLEGDPAAQRVRDVLPQRGASERVADELREAP